jgi:hypothetical protein
MRVAFFILSVAFATGCSCPSARTHRVSEDWNDDPRKYGDTFDWHKSSPTEFLGLLEKSGDIYTVLGLHHDWVEASDVDALVGRLDSKTPCAYVVSAASSKLPHGRSTVGREAAYLLEGYRLHYYPPQLSSADFEPNREELRQWYRAWSTRK